ncbi:hypothetical protein [Candidatus Frankia alpina]|uniref:hypothetical protein n=1 Tax=Candidatus Frankia alpina TaxID=2699483 RepID=UPI001A98ED53|nr:hypothetical protein [Candidatus Frankia alpina]
MRIASRPFAPPDPDVRRLGADIPAAALAPGNLASAALLGLPPSWPLLLAWATVAALMVIAQAVVHARHGGRGRPRARRAAATPRTRPVPPSAWSGDAPHRFDPTWFEPLADRMSRLLQDFLTAAVPRPGRPARIDLRAPSTTWFVDAFTAASDLLIGTCQTDRPDTLAAAVREAERRWGLVDTWTRETARPAGSPPPPLPPPLPPAKSGDQDNPDVTDHGPHPM